MQFLVPNFSDSAIGAYYPSSPQLDWINVPQKASFS